MNKSNNKQIVLNYDFNCYYRCKETGDDMSLACAAAWFEYGNALLTKEEDNPSDGLLGNQQPTETEQAVDSTDITNILSGQAPVSIVPADIEVDEENEENENDEDEEVNDLQIAWESFEVIIYIFIHIFLLKLSYFV